jgi:antitoxin component YwqK of YwqJK toxin-antitoxin module
MLLFKFWLFAGWSLRMNVAYFRWFALTLWIGAFTALAAIPQGEAYAQGADEDDSVKITPYTGPPIYLDEPEVVAEPTIVRTQTFNETYEDGKKRVEREVAYFSDNHIEAHGGYREFYSNGKPFVEGQFRQGRQEGDWNFYHDNGQINRKATYKNGQPDGAWDVLRADGTLAAKRSFRNGQRHGEWITYDETGAKPLRVEQYKDGKPDGVIKTWFPSGAQRQQLGFKDGVLHGTSIEWDEKGVKRGEVNYADGKLHGTRTLWLVDGRVIVQQYENGRLVSQSTK